MDLSGLLALPDMKLVLLFFSFLFLFFFFLPLFFSLKFFSSLYLTDTILADIQRAGVDAQSWAQEVHVDRASLQEGLFVSLCCICFCLSLLFVACFFF